MFAQAAIHHETRNKRSRDEKERLCWPLGAFATRSARSNGPVEYPKVILIFSFPSRSKKRTRRGCWDGFARGDDTSRRRGTRYRRRCRLFLRDGRVIYYATFYMGLIKKIRDDDHHHHHYHGGGGLNVRRDARRSYKAVRVQTHNDEILRLYPVIESREIRVHGGSGTSSRRPAIRRTALKTRAS